MYIIKFAGCDRLFDLGDAAHNGNKVNICHQWEPAPHQRWKFERLSDDAGEEEQRLPREIAERDQQLAAKDQRLATKDQQLADKTLQLAEVVERLKSKEQELNRLHDLGSCGEASGRYTCRDALSQANDTIRDRDIELLKLQNQMLREKMENDAYKQQRETGELREKVEKLEQLVTQVGVASLWK
ncbi:hypothetical protein FRC06_000273 [Ceratobasidium sp. 370]|nr:hypothetical protein FRC06_000273 [Ceratobasidium sp. 370]